MSIAAAEAVLLDTCAVIWLANGDPMAPEALECIARAARTGALFVSPISAWEVGLLCRARANRPPAMVLLPDARTWFARVMALPGVREARLTPEIAVDASNLPGELHGDPGDRLIIATARHLGVPVVTRDTAMVAYAAAGHVGCVRC